MVSINLQEDVNKGFESHLPDQIYKKDDMISNFKTDKLIPCVCGFKPDHYSVAYGKTPYDVFCPVCKKQTTFAKCLITGWHGNLIDYWNNHIAMMTLDEMEKEVQEFRKERKKVLAFDGKFEGCEEYVYYWIKDKGETLYVR